jgi:hypothetical protein
METKEVFYGAIYWSYELVVLSHINHDLLQVYFRKFIFEYLFYFYLYVTPSVHFYKTL